MAGQDKIFVVKNGLVVNGSLLFANNSKVGINNTTPDSALTVTGAANVQGTLAVTNAATFSNTVNITGELSVANINTIPVSAFILANSVPTYTNVTTYNANLVINSGLIANGNIGWAGAVLLSNGSSVYWGTASGVSVAGAGNNTEVQFNRNGALGANATLTWNDTTGLLTTNVLTIAQTAAYFVANGNFGLGTASPGYRATIQTNSNTVNGIDVLNSSTNASAQSAIVLRSSGATGLFVGQVRNGNGAWVWLKDNAPLELATNDTARVRVAANGFVGIACSSPTTELDVSGNVTATILRTGATVSMNSTVINVGSSTINATNYSGTANNALYLGGNVASAYQLNSTLNANIAAYLPTYAGTVNATAVTTTTFQIGATYANSTTVNATAMTIGGQWTANATYIYGATGVVQSKAVVGGMDNTESANVGVAGYSNTSAGVGGYTRATGPGVTGVSFGGGAGVAGYSNSGVGGYFQSNTNAPLQVVANTTTVVYVGPGGNTGFGTSSPNGKIHVHGGYAQISGTGNNAWALMANSTANNHSGLLFTTGGCGYFLMKDISNNSSYIAGNNSMVGVNRVDPSYTLDVSGSFRATGLSYLNSNVYTSNVYSGADSVVRFAFSGNNTLYYGGGTAGWVHNWKFSNGTDIAVFSGSDYYVAGNITAYWSDQRLKKEFINILPFDSLTRICSLQPVRHGWNEEGQAYSGRGPDWREDSLIAQEVQAVIPEGVVVNELAKGNNKDYLSLNESKIIPHLVGAIKALKEEIDNLKTEIATLKGV